MSIRRKTFAQNSLLKKNDHIPPKRAEQFLQWFIRGELAEEVLGDLEEKYYSILEQKSPLRAKINYWFQVFNYMRPFAIRPFPFTSYFYLPMIRHNFLISWRTLVRNKSYSFINILGLTLGIACALVILMIVRYELSFDTFHADANRIYRIVTGENLSDADTGTPHKLRDLMEEDFPQVELGAVAYKLNPRETQILVNDEPEKNENIVFASVSFFEMFDFKWVEGNPANALNQPGQVVISQSLAEAWFDGDAIGKPLKLNNQFDLLVSGILADMPQNTDFPIEIAVSHATFAQQEYYEKTLTGNTNSYYQTFVRLHKGINPAEVNQQFPAFIDKHLGEGASEKAHLLLQPLADVHFNTEAGDTNFSRQSISRESIYGLGFIGILILLVACINFINLATARSVKRSREVGIRKVLGSNRKQLIAQFLSEAFLLCIASTLLAIIAIQWLLPSISAYLNIEIFSDMLFQPQLIFIMMAGCVILGLLSGYYPAIILSRLKPITNLKTSFNNLQSGGLLLRRGLVTFQFIITFILISSTIVVNRQLHYFHNTSLGFDKEGVITFDLPRHDSTQRERIKIHLLQNPSIKDVAYSLNTPSATINKWWAGYTSSSQPDEELPMEHKAIDGNYVDMYDIELIAGRNIIADDSTIDVIINESMMHAIGFEEPAKVLGQTISFWNVRNAPVVGVAKDFHSVSLHQEIHPVMLWQGFDFMMQKASVKIDMNQAQEAISTIEAAFTETFPENYFSFAFLDDELATFYKQETKTSRLLLLFSLIAIFIGCLGLYGLVSFMAAQRTREVSIRKVLGASVEQIVYLFSKEFALLLIIAFVIATPLAWYFMQSWLEGFTFKVELSWWMFALAGMTGFLIAGLTISYQSMKAARVNPAESLRSE